ncbi:Reverse transcriptase [Theobroma cacao]|nr:Reverse transcriptase [Theobroma cacao]
MACYLINRSLSIAIELKTPKKVWSGKPVDYSMLRVFGCPAYALVSDGKLESKAKKCISLSYASKWLTTMNEDIKSLHRNQAWELVKPHKGQKVMGCKWVFKKKEGIPGVESAKFKAQLVAKGYTHRDGIDYNKVFSLVVKHSLICMMLAIVAYFNFELEQLDVKTTFLHSELEDLIYMKQPEGFVVLDMEDRVCLLKRSLYGLKQYPGQWYKRYNMFMEAHRYTRSVYDGCVYYKKLPNDSFIYMLLYVDDMLIAAKSMSNIDVLKEQLSGEFEMKDLVGSIMYAMVCTDLIFHMLSIWLVDSWINQEKNIGKL